MAGIPADKRFDQLGIDLFTVGTDVDLEFTSVEEATTSEPRSGLELVIAQAQHLLAQIDNADVSGHARAVAEAAACQRLNGVIEAAKAVAETDAYANAEESLIDDDATPGGYRRHAARTEEDCSDRYLSRRQLVLGDLGPALGLKASLAGGLLDRSLRLVQFMPKRAAAGHDGRVDVVSLESRAGCDGGVHRRASGGRGCGTVREAAVARTFDRATQDQPMGSTPP